MSPVSATLSLGPLLLLWSLQSGAVGAQLAAPQNLRMISFNTNYTMHWDWDQSAAPGLNVTFTTEYASRYELKYKKKSPNWIRVCDRTPHKSCDFTSANLLYLGIFVLRVRANANESHSDWVNISFHPDKEAALGPPSKVDLSLAGGYLEISISDPLTSNNTSMKEHVKQLFYRIHYWERSDDTQALRIQTLDEKINVVTLSKLKAWTWYCIRVQSRYDFYNKSSSFTPALCMQTEGPVPWWQIVLYFLASVVFFFLLVLASLCCFLLVFKKLKATLNPSIQLPSHFSQHLRQSPGSDLPRLLTPDSQSELLCDKVIICQEPPLLEIHIPPPEALSEPPSGLEVDNSVRHSRQDSSGSTDSGVYSTGGSSGLKLPNSNQPSMGETFWQGSLDSEHLKMKDMAPSLKSPLLMADEGVVDVCV